MIVQINPVALSIGSFSIYWYGIMYLLAFLTGWFLLRKRSQKKDYGWSYVAVDDVVTWVMLGIVLGARVGYILFYDFAAYMLDPLELFRIWNGGMSFHGGFIGVMLALFIWSKRNKRRFLSVCDFIIPVVPLGLFFGRIGNFINAELWGKPTDLPWGMIFPMAGLDPRHPSQLYQAGLEGLLLFAILWVYSRKVRSLGAISGMFCVLYAIFRILVEFIRLPDAHIGYVFANITMGQILSLPILALGIFLCLYARKSSKNILHDRVVLADGSIIYVKRYTDK